MREPPKRNPLLQPESVSLATRLQFLSYSNGHPKWDSLCILNQFIWLCRKSHLGLPMNKERETVCVWPIKVTSPVLAGKAFWGLDGYSITTSWGQPCIFAFVLGKKDTNKDVLSFSKKVIWHFGWLSKKQYFLLLHLERHFFCVKNFSRLLFLEDTKTVLRIEHNKITAPNWRAIKF